MRYLLAIAVTASAAFACGCQAEIPGDGYEVEYFEPDPEFRLAMEAARLKAERQAAQDGESAPKDVLQPEPHEPTSE